MEIREIRKVSGMNRSTFAKTYHIPLRTVEDWEADKRKCPDYVKEMLERIVKEDAEMAKNWTEILRVKAEPTVDSIKAALAAETGEDDLLGLDEHENPQEYLERWFRDGSLEQDGEYIVVNMIL